MVTQFGLSTTSTLADVGAVLQNAIAQEEATISGAQERLDCYQQQLATLASLVTLSEPTNGATNGATTSESNGAVAVPEPLLESAVLTETPPKRTGGKSTAKSTASKSTAKATVSQPQAQVKTESAAAAPATSAVLQPAVETVAPEVVANIPRPVRRFQGKSIPEAILAVLEEQPSKALTTKDITKTLYGAAQLKDATVEKKLIRTVSSNLTQGLKREVWQRVGQEPSLYQALPVS